MKNEKVVDLLPNLIKHTNHTLRKEAIAILRNFPSPKTLRMVMNLMKDSNEEIRILALRILSSLGNKDTARKLGETLNQKSFEEKPLQERKTYFHTIAKIAGDEFIPYLEGILSTKNWFGRQNLNDLYQCATFALTVVGTPLATKTLKGLCKSNNRSVRRLCEVALRHMEKPQIKQTG